MVQENAGLSSSIAVLGPFVGHTTSDSVRLWLQHLPSDSHVLSRQLHFSLHSSLGGPAIRQQLVTVAKETCWTGIVEFSGLEPDTTYFYQVAGPDGESLLIRDELTPADLHCKTLPENPDHERLDFLLLSCHNPEAGRTKSKESTGFEVWSTLPSILKQNPEIRFVLLAGDQVYLDDAAKGMGQSAERRMDAILDAYRTSWSDINYRKILCSLPAYMMWDDHDIVDGWGSEESSFENPTSSNFKKEYLDWFGSAKQAFWYMQGSRNPDTFGISKDGPFDSCFRVGNCAFILADLRSNRNSRRNEIWLDDQFSRVKAWIANQKGLDTLFFVSPVVFAHGDPDMENAVGKLWAVVLALVGWLRSKWIAKKLVDSFDRKLGDIRDDLADAWFSEPNAATAAKVLDYLFGLQNSSDGALVSTVVLTGDIHTSGYSNIYSDDPAHGNCALIPQIVSSPVSYSAFPWFGEALHRSRTKTVRLASDGRFKAQISHHFAQRCATVISVRRPTGAEKQLKIKFYLEGLEEPTTVIFDLLRLSHRERVSWV